MLNLLFFCINLFTIKGIIKYLENTYIYRGGLYE